MLSGYFWYFWSTIQNTTNRHVSNAYGLLAVFISFPLVRCCCCCCGSCGFLLLLLRAPNPTPWETPEPSFLPCRRAVLLCCVGSNPPCKYSTAELRKPTNGRHVNPRRSTSLDVTVFCAAYVQLWVRVQWLPLPRHICVCAKDHAAWRHE